MPALRTFVPEAWTMNMLRWNLAFPPRFDCWVK